MEINYIAIGKRIRTAREKLSITQEKLSDIINLSPSHMSHIENGKTKLSLPSLILIANALNTTVDSLLYDNIDLTYDSYDKDFKDLLSDCTTSEREVILQSAIQVKTALKLKK